MITSVLSPYCCRKNTSLYLDHLQLLYKEDPISPMRPCIVSRHPTLNYFKITLLLSMHIISHLHHNYSCISIIEDHNHFCVPSNHHQYTNTPPHIQLLLDNGRHFFYPQNITTHTTTMQNPLPNQTSSTLPYSPLSLFQSIHKETKTVERNEMRFHIDENHNIKLLPQSTPLQEHTEVYLVVVRGVGGIRKRSSSKTSFP